jgi:hypothetical protein
MSKKKKRTIRMAKGAFFNNPEGVYKYESQALGEIGPSANWKILKDPKGPFFFFFK